MYNLRSLELYPAGIMIVNTYWYLPIKTFLFLIILRILNVRQLKHKKTISYQKRTSL